MNQEIKQKWVDALRSGQYQQNVGSLTDEERTSFCCLGVLCDIYSKEEAVEWRKEGIKDKEESTWWTMHSYNAILPPDVQIWAGLDSGNPSIKIYHPNGVTKLDTLATFNDASGTFESIADIIDAQHETF